VLAIVIQGSLTFISIGYMLISFVKTTEGGQGNYTLLTNLLVLLGYLVISTVITIKFWRWE